MEPEVAAHLAAAPTPNADRLTDRAADFLRDLIGSGTFKAGQRLVEVQLADQFGMSRGPIREAFKELAREGLVINIPRRGTYVVELSPRGVGDLLEVRAAIESFAARLVVARHDPVAIAHVEVACRALQDACATHDYVRITGAHDSFHEAVCRVTGNARLHSLYVAGSMELRYLLRLDAEHLHEAGVDFCGQHDALLAVLRLEEPSVAAEAFRVHVEQTANRVVSRLTGRESPER